MIRVIRLVKSFKSSSKILRTTNSLPSPERFVQAGEPKTMSSRGFTLIEIIVVIVILSIVSAITVKFVIDSLRIYTMTVNQKTLFDEGKLALERMCRDIRDAQSITSVTAGPPGSITFTRTNATGFDAGPPSPESITFRQNSNTLEKVKGGTGYAMASNVNSFTVANATNEIQLQLTLQLTSGENVTLQTKVYPKNLVKDTTYKNFYQNWMEVIQ
jgi:prepilin-type N-terminal cleavage/methylation domain-containing protein